MTLGTFYPTREHEAAAESFVRFVTATFDADAILLVNSCARGKATRDSCLDIIMLSSPEKLDAQVSSLQRDWQRFQECDPAIQALKTVGRYSVVHADFVDGVFHTRIEMKPGDRTASRLRSVTFWPTACLFGRAATITLY